MRFLNPNEAGVAFLARTLTLQGNNVLIRPRQQPLQVPPGTHLVAVARLESSRISRPAYSPEQSARAAEAVADLAHLPGVVAVQVDYDATNSERGFYREFLADLRVRLPQTTPLSITALASWCLGDNWLDGLPIDEAVPMLFQMGPDGDEVRAKLARGDDFSSEVCRASIGIETDEAFDGPLTPMRVYVFPSRAWSPQSFARATAEVRSR